LGNCRQFPRTFWKLPVVTGKLPAVSGNYREFSTHFRMMTKKKSSCHHAKKCEKIYWLSRISANQSMMTNPKNENVIMLKCGRKLLVEKPFQPIKL
jgi:hypothetical protein